MAQGGADVEVRREDQLLINEFGRLNARLHERRGDMDEVKKAMEQMDDATTELAMGDGGDVKLLLGGESFVDVGEDMATNYCEREQEKLQAELDAHQATVDGIQARQKELKALLYGRFGSSINLEER